MSLDNACDAAVLPIDQWLFSGTTLGLRGLPESGADDRLYEIHLDRKDGSVNKLDMLTFRELRTVLDLLDGAQPRGVLISSGRDAFVVGADIFEFTSLFREPQDVLLAETGRNGQSFDLLASLPCPVVAAVNGLALGGGLELALLADRRVLANDGAIGLPEIALGLIPGLGGTVRLARLIGPAAIGWTIEGTPRNAEAALAAGAVDLLAAPDQLRSSAISLLTALADEPADSSSGWRADRVRRSGPAPVTDGLDQALAEARKTAARRHPGVEAGPVLIDLMARSLLQDTAQALVDEREAFCRLTRSASAFGLVRVFINDQAIKRKSRQYRGQGARVGSVGVIGAGIMGGGIACASALKGVPVRLRDIAEPALAIAEREIRSVTDRQCASGRMTPEQAGQILDRVSRQLTLDGFDSTDLVIEAIVENLDVKRRELAALEKSVRDDTVIASNTSSLRIADIATALARPERFVGLHFFNPVPAMPLVEVIRGPQTGDAATAVAAAYAVAIGKVPVVVRDCTGFLVNRILTPMALALLDLLEEGVDVLAIDRAAQSFGWPMGPALLQDVIGMDTSLHVIDCISAGYPERMGGRSRHAIRRLVANGRFGQKTGIGFYRHGTDEKGRPVRVLDEESLAIIAAEGSGPVARHDPGDAVLIDRLMLPLVFEAIRCLEEGIVETAAELDMALLLGLGFPRAVGGALVHADQRGAAALLDAASRFKDHGPLYHAPDSLKRHAAENSRYYAD